MNIAARFFLYVLALCLAVPASAQIKGNQVPTAEEMLNISAQGRLFWIAIPPNESQQANVTTRALEIYVTSSFDTEVTMEVPGLGFGPKTKKVKALDITTFTDAPEGGNEMSWAYEVRTSERVTGKGIKLSAPHPISVYVLSAKRFTSEGYLALPVNTWGREYMHLCYYDYPEPAIVRGGGFLLIAQEDDTEINFRLSGTQSFGRTLGSKGIGQPYSIVLDEGQTYLVQGDGTDRAFDMSGTRVFSNKPIGMISFHMRTIIPTSLGFSSRDNLISMVPPIETWGQTYVSVEFKRVDRGDFFRIIAAEDNTEFEVIYYDRDSKVELGRRQGLLSAGQLREYEETNPTPGTESIRGVAVWKANKPVFLMQYSYSTGWDGFQDYDPFMVPVVAQEQFIPATVFQTPSRADFNTNWFNIIAEGDPDDETGEKLKTIELDGKLVWKTDPKFIANNIPGTNLFWARINVPPGAHRVKGETNFGGYIYGFSQFESYGWPAAMALNKLDELDTIPPTIEIEDNCGVYEIESTELVVAPSTDDPRQIDQGISAIELVAGEDEENPVSYNVELELVTAKEVKADPKVVRFKYRIKVLDLSEDARAVFIVLDRAGNQSIDTIDYIAEVVQLEPDPIDFGNVRLGRTKQLDAKLINPKNRTIEVRSFKIGSGLYFRIVEPAELAAASEDTPFIMEANVSIPVVIEYEPQIETSDLDDPEAIDTDSVFALTSCREFPLAELRGRGVMPHIRVADYDVGIQSKGRTVCADTKGNEGILVENVGTDVLTIDGFNYDAAKAVFEFDGGAPVAVPGRPNANPPWILQPGESMVLQRLCFKSDETDLYDFDIEFDSDTDPKDEEAREHISKWEGGTIESGPFRGNYTFAPIRVGTTDNGGIVELMNFGADIVDISGIREFRNPSGFFKMERVYIKSQRNDDLLARWTNGENVVKSLQGIDPETPVDERDPGQIIVVEVSYSPAGAAGEGNHQAIVVPDFFDQLGDPIAEADIAGSGEVLGTGIIPKITASGYDFEAIACGEVSAETGTVTINNPSQSEALHIYSVEFQNAAQTAYTWVETNPFVTGGVVQPFDIPTGESRTLQVAFEAVGGSIFNEPVVILSDAHEGDPAVVDPTETIVDITGSCFDGDVLFTGWDFGDVLLCDVGAGNPEMTNTNQTEVTVLDIQLAGDDPEQFNVLDDPQQNPIAVQPNSPYLFTVEFAPTRTGTFSAVMQVFTDQRPEPYEALLTGEAHDVTVSFDLEDDNTPVTPGAEVNLDLTIAGDDVTTYDDIDEAEISGLIVTLTYDLSSVKLLSFDSEDALWNDVGRGDITATQTQDGIETAVFEVSGNSFIEAAGKVGAANFRVFLSGEEQIDIDMSVEILREDRRTCVIQSSTPGRILMDPVCLNHNRLITLSGNGFALRAISPNPVASGNVNIDYSLGFQVHTDLVLYNSMGEVVQVLVEGVQSDGVHQVNVNTADLPAGVYTYRITAGPFSQSQSMVITK